LCVVWLLPQNLCRHRAVSSSRRARVSGRRHQAASVRARARVCVCVCCCSVALTPTLCCVPLRLCCAARRLLRTHMRRECCAGAAALRPPHACGKRAGCGTQCCVHPVMLTCVLHPPLACAVHRRTLPTSPCCGSHPAARSRVKAAG
jgi:hypothetical protein